MALRFRCVRENMEKARERLRADPDDDLSDLIEKMDQDDAVFKKQSRMVILRNFIVNGLFGYDHKGALRGITKIIALKPPHKPVDSKKANELLLILWESCAIFRDDVDLLVKELEMDDGSEVSLEELPYQ